MASITRGLRPVCHIGQVLLLVAVSVFAASSCAYGQERFSEYDLMMFDRPSMPEADSERIFPDGLHEVWRKALDRPDAELQRLVIDTLGIAHRRGLEGIDAFEPRLIELAKQPNQRLDVLRAIAGTLVTLDARDQTELLAEMSQQHGLMIAEIVEPAFGQWKSPVLEDVWMERIRDGDAGQSLSLFAIDGLRQLGSTQAIEPLSRLLEKTGGTTQQRSSVARAMGEIQASGLVSKARGILDATSLHPQLNAVLAVHLLARHDDQETIELLQELALQRGAAVQSIALQRLYEIGFEHVDQLAAELIDSPDVNVRRWVARAMVDTQSVDRIGMLCSLLDDINPSLRRDVRNSLIELAELESLRDEVIAETMDVLDSNLWRGCEQACLVLARLDHKPSAPRMVELLGHERGDVNVAAAWGLTQLRVERLLPDMLDHAASVLQGFRSGALDDDMPGASLHVAHLFNAFGDQLYRPSEPLLREYLPKDFSLGTESRAAAAWALGMFYEDDPQEDLVKIMVQRMTDMFSAEPETFDMQQMCAVSLGRMNAESALPALRKFANTLEDSGLACFWAIEQITGEPSPPPEAADIVVDGWFLAPIPDDEAEE